MSEVMALFDAAVFDGVSWWSVVLAAALVVRALTVLALGPDGAAWRGVLAVIVGALAVAQLALEGPSVALLPLHAAAAAVVALLPWERPHPEPPRLILGRNRHRRARPPRLRAALALLLVLAVVAWTFLAPI